MGPKLFAAAVAVLFPVLPALAAPPRASDAADASTTNEAKAVAGATALELPTVSSTSWRSALAMLGLGAIGATTRRRARRR